MSCPSHTLVTALVALGCAPAYACTNQSRTALTAPDGIPAFTIDRAASEVVLEGSTDADEVREVGSAALDSMVEGRTTDRRRARFQAKVTGGVSFDAAGVTCGILVGLSSVGFLGALCPSKDYFADVDLVLEVGGQTFRGEGSANHSAGVLPTTRGVETLDKIWRSTVHDAFQDALVRAKPTGAPAENLLSDSPGKPGEMGRAK